MNDKQRQPDYWLAAAEMSPHGYASAVRLVDGPHSKPEGVAQAAKLIRVLRLSAIERPVMVAVSPVPDVDVPVNEKAVAAIRHMQDVNGEVRP